MAVKAAAPAAFGPRDVAKVGNGSGGRGRGRMSVGPIVATASSSSTCHPKAIVGGRRRCYDLLMPTYVAADKKVERELWTTSEFLEWLKPGLHADLIDGERFTPFLVSLRRADLLNFVDRLLDSYIDLRCLGKLYRGVVAVRLGARNVFLPDLAFFTRGQLPRRTATFASEVPALAVEALSDWSAERDVGPKFAEYERAWVLEYWVLDPATVVHRFYRREGELLVEFAAGEAVIRSLVLDGFEMERTWLDPERLPKIAEALAKVTA